MMRLEAVPSPPRPPRINLFSWPFLQGEHMTRRKWLWFSLAAIPLVTAAALAASTFGSIPTPQETQVEPPIAEPSCCGPDWWKDCPPDCRPEACLLCTQ